MIKKIVVGTLLAAMIGLLVYGAWYRTQAKAASESASTATERHGQESAPLQNGTEVQQGAGYQGGQQFTTPGSLAGAAVSGPSSLDPGRQSSIDSPQAEVTELVTLFGAVESAAAEVVVVDIPDQAPVELSGRALSFALEQGFSLLPGDMLKLTGFYEEQDFEVQAIENFTTGQSLALREETGRPLWAGGRGRRGG